MGHSGCYKVVKILVRWHWFPKLRIRNYINYHFKCKNIPFETIHVGHFPQKLVSIMVFALYYKGKYTIWDNPSRSFRRGKSKNSKKKYVFLVIDTFSKFLRLYPVRTPNPKEICYCMKSYFNAYSRSLIIVTDTGNTLSSGHFQSFLEDNNIKHVRNAIALPNANGEVESVIVKIYKLYFD